MVLEADRKLVGVGDVGRPGFVGRRPGQHRIVWTTIPLWMTVIQAGASSFLSLSKRGA